MFRLLIVLILLLSSQPALAVDQAEQERQLLYTGEVDLNAKLGDKITVAILPFATPKDRPDLDQYSEGTMDSLISGLKHVPKFIMVDRGRIDRVRKEQGLIFQGLVDPKTAVKYGKFLSVKQLVTGSISAQGEQLKLEATVIDVQTGQPRSTSAVTGNDIFALQNQLADRFLEDQQVTLTPEQQQRKQQVIKSTADVKAYSHYIRGRTAYLRYTSAGFLEAVGWYQKAIAADPKYALAYSGLGEAWSAWGFLKEQNGEPFREAYEQALASSQQALALNPKLPEAHRALSRAARRLGHPEPEYRDAIRRALELNPQDGETWLELWLASGNGRTPDHRFIRRAVELNPDLVTAHNNIGNALVDLNRFEDAIVEYREAIRINPDVGYAYSNLSYAMTGLKRYDEAITICHEALRLDPNLAMAHNNLGWAYLQMKRPEDAVTSFEAALKINPDLNKARLNLGFSYYQLKRLDDALATFQEAVKLAPGDANAHHNLGIIHKELGRWAEAVREWEAVLKLNPNHQGALKWLPVGQAKLKGGD